MTCRHLDSSGGGRHLAHRASLRTRRNARGANADCQSRSSGRALRFGLAVNMAAGGALLDVRDIALRFGGIVALDGVSFTIDGGEILGVIGPKGPGKATAVHWVSPP